MGYRFEDFKTEQDNKTVIVDGKYGYKLKISIFNPCVPLYYKEQLLKIMVFPHVVLIPLMEKLQHT